MSRLLNQQETAFNNNNVKDNCKERADASDDVVKYVFDKQSEGVEDIYKAIENTIKEDRRKNEK